MARVIGLGVGADVCRALNIDPSSVRTIELRFAPDEIVSAKVERYVHDHELKTLMKVLEKYEMHQRPTDTTALDDTVASAVLAGEPA